MKPTPHPQKQAIPRIIPLLCAVACLLLTAMTCQKKDLPEPTQDGKNTFGCKINGEVFAPYTHWASSENSLLVSLKHDAFPYLLTIIVTNSNSKYSLHIQYHGTQLFSVGKYKMIAGNNQGGFLNIDEGTTGFSAAFRKAAIQYTHFLNTSKVNEVEITKLDLENNIVSGKFNFHLVNSSSEPIEVTEGRFDVKF